MSETNPTDPSIPPTTPDATQPPPPKPRKRRRWPWIVGGLLLLLVLLVALLPTIASTGPVKSLVVSKINDQLNGTLAIKDWSLGWTSGVTLNEVKIDDEQGARVLEIARIRVPVSLLGAIRGDIDLGETVIDKPNLVNVRINEDGSTNLEKLAKPAPKAPPSDEGPTELPNIRGSVKINDLRASISGPGVAAPIEVQPSSFAVEIPSINAPISNSGKLVYRVGEAPAGTIAIEGTVDAIENNQVNVDQLRADQKLQISNADLSAAAPFMQKENEKVTLAGVGNGALAIQADGLKSASVDGQFSVSSFAFGGTPLKGDTYQSSKINLPIKVTTSASGNDTLIKVETLKVETDHATVDVSGQATQQALENLAAQKAPGSAGALAIVVDTTNLPGLVNSLRNTMGLQPEVTVKEGDVTARVDLALEPQRAVIKHKLDAQAKGTNAGKAVTLEPVQLDASVAVLPGGGAIPDLRDIALNLKSVFATVSGGGASLANVDIQGKLDLAKARQQLGQFKDFGTLDFAGAGDFQVTSKGDLTKAGGTSDVNATLNFANLVIRGLDGKGDVNQPRLAIGANAMLVRGPEGGEFIERIDKATATVQAGEANAPVVDVMVHAANVTLAKLGVERFEVQKLSADLARAQQQFGAFLPPDLKLAGNLTVAAAGSYRDDTATLDALAVDTSEKYVTVKKGDAPLVVSLKEGNVSGSGQLSVASDLPKLNSIFQSAGAEPAVTTTAGQLTSGQLAATLNLASAAEKGTEIALDGAINNLSVTTNAEPIQNETVKLAVKASAPADFSAVKVASAVIDSSFAKTQVSETELALGGGTFEMLKRAKIRIDLPDLAKTYAVANAFAPPATQPAEPTTQPAAPLDIAGSAVVNLDIAREGQITRVTAPEIAASNLSLRRGQRSFAFQKPVTLKLAADLGTKMAPTTASTQPVEQVDQIKVTQLAGDLGGIATLSSPEGVTITALTSETPAANGKLAVNGPLEPLMNLLSVVQDADPMPYRGDYAVAQTIATKTGQLQLAGNVTVNEFQVLGTDGKAQFTEKQLVLANDLVADPEKKIATINNVELSMPQSQAASVKLVGKVEDWEVQRKLDGTTLALAYDLAKVWPMVKPMLDPETQQTLKDLKIAGQFQRTFNIAGSYPAKDASGKQLAFHEAIQPLKVDGALGVGLLDTNGVNIQNLELPITLADGQLITLYMNKPREQRAAKPAQLNGGTLDLNSLLVDLTGEIPRLSIGKNQKLVANASFNPLLGDSLGKFINPIFANATRAQGLIDLTIVSCDKLALGEAMKGPQSGTATFNFSLREMDIANPLGGLLYGDMLKKVGLGAQAAETDAFRGQIQNATVTIRNGIVTEDITFEIGKKPPEGAIAAAPKASQLYPMTFKGTVALADLRQNLTVNLPSQMFNSSDIEKFFPQGIPVTLKGTTTKPQPDFGNFARAFVEAQAKSRVGDLLGGQKKEGQPDPLGGLIDDVLGGKKRQEQPQQQQPQQRQESTTQPAKPAEPDVGGLLNDILGGRKK